MIGLGAGGCGLSSLASLLAKQTGSTVTKERFAEFTAWNAGEWSEYALAKMWRNELEGGATLAGDVATYHLPYAWELCKRNSGAKVVWLSREREKMAADLAAGAAAGNPWMPATAINPWASSAPRFPTLGIPSVIEAAQLYVDFYETMAERIAAHLPGQMKRFSTRYLDTQRGQRAILDFIGIRENQITVPGGINVNPRR